MSKRRTRIYLPLLTVVSCMLTATSSLAADAPEPITADSGASAPLVSTPPASTQLDQLRTSQAALLGTRAQVEALERTERGHFPFRDEAYRQLCEALDHCRLAVERAMLVQGDSDTPDNRALVAEENRLTLVSLQLSSDAWDECRRDLRSGCATRTFLNAFGIAEAAIDTGFMSTKSSEPPTWSEVLWQSIFGN